MAITDTADALLARFGTSMTLNSTTKGTYDPATSKVINTTTAVTFNGVFTNYTDDYRRNSQVDEGDRQLICRVSTEPKVGDTITVGTETLKVKGIEKVAPANSVIIFKVRVGR